MRIEDTPHADEFILRCSIDELKRLYKALFAKLKEPGGKLQDEGDVALKLQHFLMRKAYSMGVDVTRHTEWEAWLGNPNIAPCDVRYADRGKDSSSA
jgi:hypothetical protein